MESVELFETPSSRKSSISSRKSNDTFYSTHEHVDEKDNAAQMEESSKGKVKGSVVWRYSTAGANWSILILLTVLFPIVDIFATGSDYWMSVW